MHYFSTSILPFTCRFILGRHRYISSYFYLFLTLRWRDRTDNTMAVDGTLLATLYSIDICLFSKCKYFNNLCLVSAKKWQKIQIYLSVFLKEWSPLGFTNRGHTSGHQGNHLQKSLTSYWITSSTKITQPLINMTIPCIDKLYVPSLCCGGDPVALCTWRCHDIETLSALLVLCWGNPPIIDKCPHKASVMLKFNFFLCC